MIKQLLIKDHVMMAALKTNTGPYSVYIHVEKWKQKCISLNLDFQLSSASVSLAESFYQLQFFYLDQRHTVHPVCIQFGISLLSTEICFQLQTEGVNEAVVS